MKVCILGAGAYGLALALAFHKNNNEVIVWTKLEAEKEELANTHQNQRALPNVRIPDDIKITTELSCVKDTNLVILAIPITFFRSTCLELRDYTHNNLHYCIATKGIEKETGAFCHEILESIINTKQIAILSGPTFAIDLANNSTCGLSLGTNSNATYEIICSCLQSENLKIEKNNDMIGTELCGAVKNIMAIISGILAGIQVTETTKALFLTNAIQEIGNLILSFQGSYQTINTLAGIGDLLLTCNSKKSRNYCLGLLLSKSYESKEKKQTEIINYLNCNTVEGYHTLLSIYSIIQKNNLHSPLIESLYNIIFNHQNQKELLTVLTCK